MVGVPSAKGCASCLRRSVKCDESRPSCLKCRKGGRVCPGYEKQMTFIDERAKQENRRVAKRQHGASNVRKPRGRKVKRKRTAISLANRMTPTFRSSPSAACLQSPRAALDQLVSYYVASLFPLGAISVQLSLLGSWLWHIPPRLGSNNALDKAIISVALAHFGKDHGDELASKEAQVSYLAALRNLAALLDNKRRQFDAEVLCAALLLGFYETLVGTSFAWIKHAGGAARLMQLRGAHRSYESAFEYSMFLSCRGSIIAQALGEGEPCFLEDEKWQSIPDGLINFPLMPAHPQLYHAVFCQFAAVPGTIKRLRAGGNGQFHDAAMALSRAVSLRDRMKQWYIEYTSADEGLREPVVAPGSPRDIYVYYDTMSASTITMYFGYLVLVNRAINARKYALENQHLAKAICMSAVHCWQTGYCGTTSMAFALPIAESVLGLDYQQWAAPDAEDQVLQETSSH